MKDEQINPITLIVAPWTAPSMPGLEVFEETEADRLYRKHAEWMARQVCTATCGLSAQGFESLDDL